MRAILNGNHTSSNRMACLPNHYDRWRGWTSADPRWQVELLDTTQWAEQQTLQALNDWVQRTQGHPSLLSPTTRWWESFD
jgi:hypothetical protein